jgi:hypothetical protein
MIARHQYTKGKWSGLYDERVQCAAQEQQARIAKAASSWSSLLAAKKCAAVLRRRTEPTNELPLGTDHGRSWKSLTRPRSPQLYEGRHNLFCEMCCLPLPTTASVQECLFCNSAMHTACANTVAAVADSQQPRARSRQVRKRGWTCPDCIRGKEVTCTVVLHAVVVSACQRKVHISLHSAMYCSTNVTCVVLLSRTTVVIRELISAKSLLWLQVDALKQQDAALVITRFISRIARQNEYSKEKQRALRIEKLLQLNLSQAQVILDTTDVP